MIVSTRTVKPQKVRRRHPGTVHFSSFRCPITSVACVETSRPRWARAEAIRSGGLPGGRQPLQPPEPPPGDRERDRRQDQADRHPQDHARFGLRSDLGFVSARGQTQGQPCFFPMNRRPQDANILL